MWGLALADFGRDPSIGGEFERDGFPKKTRKNCSQNFQVLRHQAVIIHNSAMIRDGRKWSLYGMSSVHFIFLLLESFQSLSPGMYVPYKKGAYPNFWQRPMSDIAY